MKIHSPTDLKVCSWIANLGSHMDNRQQLDTKYHELDLTDQYLHKNWNIKWLGYECIKATRKLHHNPSI